MIAGMNKCHLLKKSSVFSHGKKHPWMIEDGCGLQPNIEIMIVADINEVAVGPKSWLEAISAILATPFFCFFLRRLNHSLD